MVLDLGFLIVLAAIAAGLGLRVLRAVDRVPGRPSADLALAIPLGLGLIGLGVLGLGESGHLAGLPIAAMMLMAAAVGVGEVIQILPAIRAEFHLSPRWRSWDSLLVAVLLGTLITALGPVTDGDALCYHLQVPKVFLEARSVGFDPDLHETIYPLLTEMLYAVALKLRSPVACRLVQWLLGVVFAMNVTAIARPVLGDRARWAGTVALLVPAVSNGMGAPLNDVALAAFGNATIHAWFRWNDRPCRETSLLLGLLAGLAMGVKYPALVLNGLLGAAMLGLALRDLRAVRAAHVPALIAEEHVREPAEPGGQPAPSGVEGESWVVRHIKGRHYIDPRAVLAYKKGGSRGDLAESKRLHLFRHVLIFGLTALMVGGAWYARAYYFTGNPVYPFFRGVFGGAGLDEVLDPIKRPMPVTAWNLLTALGPLTLDPSRFDSVAHQLGPLFLLVLPALLWERPPRQVWWIVGIGYAFLMACLTQRQSMRFVLIAVGPMAVGVAWVASRWWDRPSFPARALVALLLAGLGFEASLALARTRHGLPVVIGQESAEDYLTRREPTYRVGRWIDKNLPQSAHLVGQDHRGFYIPRPYAMELAHRRRTGLGSHGESAGAIAEALREDGFTHLLLCPPEPEDAVEFDPTLSRLLAPWIAEHPALYHERIVDADGVVRNYAIYELIDAGPSPDFAGLVR